MNLLIKKLDGHAVDQFMDLIRLFNDVFELNNVEMPSSTYLQQVLNQHTFWVFVALIDEEVVGGLTAYILSPYYTQRPVAYLYDLAVSRPFQRRGIGRQLLAALTNQSRCEGIDEVFVQAHEEDAEAINFYRTTGGLAQNVVHFTYPLTPDLPVKKSKH